MRVLRARYGSGREFLSFYLATPADGGVFYPTREALEVGQEMAVEVRFPGLPARTVLRGKVAWRRRGRHRSKLRAGVGIEFLAEETRKRDFLLRAARGAKEEDRAALPKRRHRRVPTEIQLSWRLKDGHEVIAGTLQNIGLGGAYIRTPVPAPSGRDVILSLATPGAACAFEIEGRVAWCAEDAPGGSSFGVQFKARDLGGARRLKEVVRRVETGAPARY